jgi:hypothetical protein
MVDGEDEKVVAGHRQQLGAAGAISVEEVVETHAVIHEAILANGEIMRDPNRQQRDRKEPSREGAVEGVVEVEVVGAVVAVSTKVAAAALLVIKITPLLTTLVP